MIFLLLIFLFQGIASAGQMDSRSPGLVGLWHFNEGSGTSTRDEGVNRLTGTLAGGAAWVEGRYGKAVYYNSTDAAISIGDSALLNPTEAMTVIAWVKFFKVDTTNSAEAEDFILGRDIAGARSYDFGKGAGEAGWQAQINGVSLVFAPVLPMPVKDVWNFVVWTGNSSIGWIFYLNGIRLGIAPWTAPAAVNTITYWGRRGYEGNEAWFPGWIEEGSIRSTVITAGEVSRLYTEGLGRHSNVR